MEQNALPTAHFPYLGGLWQYEKRGGHREDLEYLRNGSLLGWNKNKHSGEDEYSFTTEDLYCSTGGMRAAIPSC